MEVRRPDDDADAKALSLAIQQNAIRAGLVRPAPFELDFPSTRVAGAQMLAEVMRPLPTDTPE